MGDVGQVRWSGKGRPWDDRRPASELAGLLIVGVFGLAAFYPLLFEDLMSKLMGLLIVGVLRPSTFRPLRVGNLMSKLMGFLLGRGGGI